MRQCRTTLRFTDNEASIIRTFAEQNDLTLSESIRRLVFWQRMPDFSLPEPSVAACYDVSDAK